MSFPDKATVDHLRQLWTNKLVRVRPGGTRVELERFAGKVGRLVTINYSGRAVVDFSDGGWYDVSDFEAVLEEVTDEAERAKYDSTVNSAQSIPSRQA